MYIYIIYVYIDLEAPTVHMTVTSLHQCTDKDIFSSHKDIMTA